MCWVLAVLVKHIYLWSGTLLLFKMNCKTVWLQQKMPNWLYRVISDATITGSALNAHINVLTTIMLTCFNAKYRLHQFFGYEGLYILYICKICANISCFKKNDWTLLIAAIHISYFSDKQISLIKPMHLATSVLAQWQNWHWYKYK